MSDQANDDALNNPDPTGDGTQVSNDAVNAEPGAAQDTGGAVQDPEFELPGSRKVKLSELQTWEKSHQNYKRLESDYTKKYQTLAQQRKSFEQALGFSPTPDDLAAFGKLSKLYRENERAAKLIDAVLSEQFDVNGSEPGKTLSPMEQKIAKLETMLSGFIDSHKSQKDLEARANGEKIWRGWAEGKKAQGIEITDEIDSSMAPFISALNQVHPEWTDEQILDEAYRHATLGQIEQNAVKKVIQTADKAKKTGTVPITPKAGDRPDSEKSYAELFMGK